MFSKLTLKLVKIDSECFMSKHWAMLGTIYFFTLEMVYYLTEVGID